MDELQQKILDYVRLNEPVSVAKIVKEMKIYRNKFYELMEPIKRSGLLFSRAGFGVFYSMESYNAWLDNGGREILSLRGRTGAESSLKTRREDPWVAREGSIKFAIMECLKESSEPLSLSQISARTRLQSKSVSGSLSYLVRAGTVEHDGKDFKRKYTLSGQVSDHDIVVEKVKGKKTGFKQFNPKKNGIVQAYMASPARQRLMAVYGRMG